MIDVLIAVAILASVLGACHRGVGREMLHTVMFAILVAVGYVLFRTQGNEAANAEDTVFWLVNSTYYILTAYVLTWVGMKVLSPLVIGRENVGLRSRFWAGILSVAKIAVVVFGLNLWFAMHSPLAHPKRLETLPPSMQGSQLVHISDRLTERLYFWLAQKNIVNYHKTLERAPTEQEKRDAELENMLGVSPSSLPPLR